MELMQNGIQPTEEAQQAFRELCDAVAKMAEAIIEAIRAVAKWITKAWNIFIKAINPKVYNLAYCHKKKRVRNKNKNRLFKEIKALFKIA